MSRLLLHVLDGILQVVISVAEQGVELIEGLVNCIWIEL